MSAHSDIFTYVLSATFPDSQKAADDLSAFSKLNESRLYKLLDTCMDTQTSLKSLVKSSVRPLHCFCIAYLINIFIPAGVSPARRTVISRAAPYHDGIFEKGKPMSSQSIVSSTSVKASAAGRSHG
jgi:hypothetical protein